MRNAWSWWMVVGFMVSALGFGGAGCDEADPADAGPPAADAGRLDAGEAAMDAGGDEDGGADDAGGLPADGGAVLADAGSDDTDAGDVDAGPGMDAGTDVDAGTDAGLDAGADAGSDAGGMVCADLNVMSDGAASNPLPDLVLSEVAPGMFIELFNTTSSPIALSSVSYQLCSPFQYAGLASIAPGTTVPARGYATVPWPPSFTDVPEGGEVILYQNFSFGSGAAILDFVCWGTNPHGTRKPLAESAGKWSGPCAPAAPTGGSMSRRIGVTGLAAGDYLGAAPTAMCSP